MSVYLISPALFLQPWTTSHLGPNFLYCGQCHILPITGWLRRLLRQEKAVIDGGNRVHPFQRIMWAGSQFTALVFFRGLFKARPAVDFSPCPRRLYWKNSLPTSGVRLWPSGVWDCGCADYRPNDGRLDYRHPFLAMGILINLPIGILSLLLISLFVYDPPYIRRGSLRIDLWGMGMLALGMGALQIMLDRGRKEDDWFGSRLIVTLAIVALVFLTGLCHSPS